MNLLLDTHLLLWAADVVGKLPPGAHAMMADPGNVLFFSAASIWEVAIKYSSGKANFHVDPNLLHRGLQENGFLELPVSGIHALAVGALPPIHKDPFDRLLVAQAIAENLTLLTADAVVARYPAPVRLV